MLELWAREAVYQDAGKVANRVANIKDRTVMTRSLDGPESSSLSLTGSTRRL